MENTDLKQIKEAIDLMSGTIGVMVGAIERLSGSKLSSEVVDRLRNIDKAKAEAITTLEFLDSTGRL